MKLAWILFLFTSIAFAHVDEGGSFLSGPKLSKASFEKVIGILQTTFSPLAEASGRKLVFMTDYKSDWAQSFARRWETDQVIVYGGIAAIKNATEDMLALGLCHELGHLYGGTPLSDEFNHLSLEGQADYWSASCFMKVVGSLQVRAGSDDDRLIAAALVLTAFYADNRSIAHPRVDNPDESVVSETLRVHPEPQCRLDTILSASRNLNRPSCWFLTHGDFL